MNRISKLVWAMLLCGFGVGQMVQAQTKPDPDHYIFLSNSCLTDNGR